MEILDAYRNDLRGVLQGLLALCTILALALAASRAKAAVKAAEYAKNIKRAFKVIRKSRRQSVTRLRLLREMMEAAEIQGRELGRVQRDNRRLRGDREKLREGIGKLSLDRDHLADELRWAKKMIPVLTERLPGEPVDFEIDL